MRTFTSVEEEAKYWLELARSRFWGDIIEQLTIREKSILLALEKDINKATESRLLGRLLEINWLKDLPQHLLQTVDLTDLLKPDEEKEAVIKRDVGKPDNSTGIL